MGATEIRVEGLFKAFAGSPVLEGVDLEIERGELVAIVGGSGCGKTVLLQHIIGNMKPDRGRVFVADHDHRDAPLIEITELGEQDLDRVRVHTAVVFQRNALFSASVYENIALWLREIKHLDEDAILERARESLGVVGLAEDPNILSKQRYELSGGMAKRVAIARALAMRPIVMYYDEPTTGLDPTNAANIHELILITHDRDVDETEPTTLIITHDKDLLQRLEPRVVMLHDGRVHFDGTFAEFEACDSPIIRPYFEVMPILHRRSLTV